MTKKVNPHIGFQRRRKSKSGFSEFVEKQESLYRQQERRRHKYVELSVIPSKDQLIDK